MRTKVCTKCNRRLAIEENFSWKSYGRGSYRSDCKDCANKAHSSRYREDKEFRDRVSGNTKRRKDRNQEFLISYLKAHPCVDCEESDIVVLEFDHIIGDKYRNVGMLAKGSSIEKITEEIAKCEVVCANCHRRRTASRGNWQRLKN